MTEGRTFWQRRVRDPIVAQLTQGITAEKIALTIAVGSGVAMFPLIGGTTLMLIAIGVALRLNQPIIQVVNVLCTPLHLSMLVLYVQWGQKLFNAPPVVFSLRYYTDIFWDDPAMFFHRFGAMAFHATVVWLLLLPVWIGTVYLIALPVLRGIARARAEAAARAVLAKPPEHPVP